MALPLLSRKPAEAASSEVNLFWKISVDDTSTLKHALPPHHYEVLEEVGDAHICLLFFGGRSKSKAAQREGLPLDKFIRIDDALSSRAGERVKFVARSFYVHHEVIVAMVDLPGDLMYHVGIYTPHFKFFVKPGTSKSCRKALDEACGTQIALPEPLPLSGIVQLEKAAPHPSQRVRCTRVPRQVQGRWVQVKQHSSMKCADILFPSDEVCNAVLHKCCSQQPIAPNGTVLDVKLRQKKQKEVDEGLVDVPASLFVAWREASINAEDLQSLFDYMTDPLMKSFNVKENSQVADKLLKRKSDGAPELVVLRLDRKARSPQINGLLLSSPVAKRMAGHDSSPEWANGARIFVPLSREEEIEARACNLQQFNIVAYSCDVAHLQKALSDLPNRQRPKLIEERKLLPPKEPSLAECSLITHSSLGPISI
mmetsp:Transcript_92634/g.163852  ORF Transcript_92634/g.163852 Transcript_92634/m.163852 type:complete len:425 (-) Transcript_92634:109-1383(-)